MRARIGRPSSKASLNSVVAVWQTPPPIDGSTSEPMISCPSRNPRAAVRGPTTLLYENVSPGRITVPSIRSAIRWTLWIRFEDEIAHLRCERRELGRDPERACAPSREIGCSSTELDPGDVVAVRRGRDGDRDLRRIDVASGSRRDDADRVSGDGELRIPRMHEPAAEPRPDRARERVAVEADDEPVVARDDAQRAGELQGRHRSEPRSVIVDDDRMREQRRRGRSGAARSRIAADRMHDRERRPECGRTGGEPAQQRTPVELEPGRRRRHLDGRSANRDRRRNGLAARARDLVQHVPRAARAREHRRNVHTAWERETDDRARVECARRCLSRVERDKPAARNVVRAAGGADRDLCRAPAANDVFDLRPVPSTHVDAEHVHAGRRLAAIFERPHGEHAARDDQRHHERTDPDDPSHPRQ